ncbi:MAG: hypothetical protein M1819_006654 [Sarea resinae]|nr:MAG: hypothetical protein M1819_006654 [Sarea resinae]
MDEGTYAPRSPDLSAYQSSYVPEPPAASFHSQTQPYRASVSQSNYEYHPPPYYPQQPPYLQPQPYSTQPMAGNGLKMEDDEWLPEPTAIASSSGREGGRRSRKVKSGTGVTPGAAEGIEVKTKFPVARIKRIMQADEDVGKVAQVTPVVVSKALELFMISLVCKASNEAKSRSSKRITAAHLKQAISKDEQFDFLQDIIAKVPDGPPAAEKAEDGDEGSDGKRKRGGRKKRKDSEEF